MVNSNSMASESSVELSAEVDMVAQVVINNMTATQGTAAFQRPNAQSVTLSTCFIGRKCAMIRFSKA